MNCTAATLALLLAAVSVSALAESGGTVCRGTLGSSTFGNILVPENTRCTLNRSRLSGDLVVGRGATLQANGVRVDGSVQAEGARQVGIGPNSQIGGDVRVRQGARANITGVRIAGDLHIDENIQRLAVTDSLIGGDIRVVGNSGGVTLERNRIIGALQCRGNRPAPKGGNNPASSGEGQCATL